MRRKVLTIACVLFLLGCTSRAVKRDTTSLFYPDCPVSVASEYANKYVHQVFFGSDLDEDKVPDFYIALLGTLPGDIDSAAMFTREGKVWAVVDYNPQTKEWEEVWISRYTPEPWRAWVEALIKGGQA